MTVAHHLTDNRQSAGPATRAYKLESGDRYFIEESYISMNWKNIFTGG
jgi:hypothetical protein